MESLEEEKDRPQAFVLGLRRDRSAISNPCDVFSACWDGDESSSSREALNNKLSSMEGNVSHS